MEIINPTPPRYNQEKKAGAACIDFSKSIYIGATLIVAGLVWLLYNLDVLDGCVFDAVFSWQMLLVVIGGYLIAQKRWALGAVFSALGAFFLVTKLLHVCISFSDVVLPVILIGAGLAVLLSVKRKE